MREVLAIESIKEVMLVVTEVRAAGARFAAASLLTPTALRFVMFWPMVPGVVGFPTVTSKLTVVY
jgi:hypothetical protein